MRLLLQFAQSAKRKVVLHLLLHPSDPIALLQALQDRSIDVAGTQRDGAVTCS